MNYAALTDYLIDEAEDRLEYFLKFQFAEGSPYSGAVPEPDRLCPPFPRNASIRLLEIIALWLCPQSRYFAHSEIPSRAKRTFAYLRREQRPSGNIDLWDCNFDSAPDSGFFLWDLVPIYRLLEKIPADFPADMADAANSLKNEVKDIILLVLEGLLNGGFHTANHRWVMASSLAAGYKLTGNSAYLDKANQYLAEGIDCNDDGEYSERSAIYNAVNNQAMIALFEELGDRKYLEFVQRNLHMMVCFFEADGSLFTGNSTRQDRGKKMYAGRYLYQYLYIAHHMKDEEAARIAAYIASFYIKTRQRPGPDCFAFLTLHPEIDLSGQIFKTAFNDARGAVARLPDYNRYFKSSGIARNKKGGFSFSLVHNNPAWLGFNSGTLGGCCRISLGYFSYGNVKIDNLETIENGYKFSFEAVGYYFEPLENPTGDLVNFRAENHSVRRLQHPNKSGLEITVRYNDGNTPSEATGVASGGIDLDFTSSGINGVHYCFEFILPALIPVSGDHFALIPKPGDYILLKDGNVTLRDADSGFTIRGGFASTELFATSRNGVERSAEGFTVYMNATTPFSKTVSIIPL